MKPLTPFDGPRMNARSPEPAEPGLLHFQDFSEDHMVDGGEFLDDALRMHEQTLAPGTAEKEDEE